MFCGYLVSASIGYALRMAVRVRMTTINMVLQLCSVSEYFFHKRVRLVKSVQSINHLVCLESPRWYVEM